MRKLYALILALFLITGAAIAQDSPDCSTESIQSQVDSAYADYLANRGEDALGDLAVLNATLTAIVESCGEPASADRLREGLWEVTWTSRDSNNCDAPIQAESFRFILTYDVASDSFLIHDAVFWNPLSFGLSSTGAYTDSQEFPRSDGTIRRYSYELSIVSPERIEGNAYYNDVSFECTQSYGLVLTLVDDTKICLVASDEGANLRTGPSTDYRQRGVLAANERALVIGQARGMDGFVWWQLENEAWLNSDVVEEAGRCMDVPQV